jgi:hypothetical protein
VQTRDDGTHVILPVARWRDHAGLPVIVLRHADGKVRRDGHPAARRQRSCAVDERGRLHGASAPSRLAEYRVAAYAKASCRNEGESRQWVRKPSYPGRLRRQDKASCLAAGTSFLSFCQHIVFAGLALCAVRCGRGAFELPSLFSMVLATSLVMSGKRETETLTLMQVFPRFSATSAFFSCRTRLDFQSSSHGTR